MNTEERNCQNCKQSFVIEPDDFSFYEKMNLPVPTFCSDCRRERRLAWRNNMSLYNSKCALCDKSVITIYAPDSGLTIYCNKCWWSDKWDPKDYGVGYDFTKSFFAQYKELLTKVPHMAIVNDDGIASLNCEYTQDWWFSKNCYMCFSGWRVENVLYSFFALAGKDIVDSILTMSETNFIYDCVNCTHAYRLKSSEFSRSCIDSAFLYDCSECKNCFMCSGLRNKKYYFKNVEYSKDEYEKILAGYNLHTYSGMERARVEYEEFILSYPRRFAWFKQNLDCSGDVVSYSKNAKYCYVAKKCENTKYGDFASFNKDSYDMSMSGELSECYECVVGDHSSKNFFGVFTVKSQNVTYTQHCHSSKNLFGCAQLRNANYCIFNKQYSKEEYEELVPKIIEHMNEMPYIDGNGSEYKYGEFYPIEHSVFGYNETIAPEQFELSRDEAISKGYKWQDNIQRTEGRQTLETQDIPDSILDIEDTITNEILTCQNCNRNYKIIPNELVFYKKMSIPVPRECFHCRHSKRRTKINKFKLYHRECMCDINSHNHIGICQNEFETSYSPDRPEIVYCEKCYQQEVV